MTELEIALVGLLILLGASVVVYSGTRNTGARKNAASAPAGDSGAPVMAGKHSDADGPGDAGGGDGGGGGGGD